MKRLFTILAACLLVTAASAQTISKGTFFVSPTLTNISFNAVTISSDGSKESMSRFGVQASGGYAVIDNLALIAGVGFQTGKYSTSSMGLFDAFVGARYYFIPSLYAGLNAVVGNVSLKNNTGSGTSVPNTGTTFGLEANVGYSWFLSERFALEPSLSFYYGLVNQMASTKFNLNMFSVNIGFLYYL